MSAVPLLAARTTVLQCTHGGLAGFGVVTPVPGRRTVHLTGQPALVVSDVADVTSGTCVFMAGQKPQPCVRARFSRGALKVSINGEPVLLSTISGTCESVESIPQGPSAPASASQIMVRGT